MPENIRRKQKSLALGLGARLEFLTETIPEKARGLHKVLIFA
ncbi:MAG: hypothetical protein ACI4JG_02145 [Acutalibacteraceae bacterium]